MPSESKHVPLRVIPEPEEGTRSVLITDSKDEDFVFIRGEDPRVRLSLDCGNCGKPLIIGIPRMKIINVVFQCPRCGSYNDT
jgi:DNA-directed RNA polymerase subunit RPC12/RpoP